jgi:hypothetical protein
MTWIEQLQDWAVMVVLGGAFYLGVTYLFRSLNPSGKLSWQGRRFRNGGALFLLLAFAGMDVFFASRRGHIHIGVAAISYAGLGLLLLLLARWWFRDRQKEAAAREALVEKLHEEGRELIPPPMSVGRKAWRWVVNVYAIFLIAAGLYALLHYLVVKFL